MIRIAVCDDDVNICYLMEEFIGKACKKLRVKLDFYMYDNSQELRAALDAGQRYELLFLDIEMEGFSGVQIGTYIRENLQENALQIAYISGKDSYAMQLFEIRPVNFLIKPFVYEDVVGVIENVLRITNYVSEKFAYRKKQDLYFVDYGRIMYFQSNNRKVELVTDDGRRIEFYGKLDDIYKDLPHSLFLSIHKSFIVNLQFVSLFEYDNLTLFNGEILPISQSKRKEIRMVQEKLTIGGAK